MTAKPAQNWRYAAGNPSVQLARRGWPDDTGLPDVTGLVSELAVCTEIPPYWSQEAGAWALAEEDAGQYAGRVRWVYGTSMGVAGWFLASRFRVAVTGFAWQSATTATVEVIRGVHPLALGDLCRLLFSRRAAASSGWNEDTQVWVDAVADLDAAGDRRLVTLADVAVPSLHTWPGTIPRAWPNRLTTRASDTAGVLTLQTDHGVEAADLVDVVWSGGKRLGMTVGAVVDNEVPISNGFGDVLPSTGTYCSVATPAGATLYLTPRAVVGVGAGARRRGAITAQPGASTTIDFTTAHDFTTADRIRVGASERPVTAADATSITVAPAVSGAVGATVSVDLVPFPQRDDATAASETAPRRYPTPAIAEPTPGALVVADGQPYRVLEPATVPATLLTYLQTDTWGEWLGHYLLAVDLSPDEPSPGDTIRLLVDYQDADNYLAAEVAAMLNPHDATDATVYHRLRLIRRLAGVETLLGRDSIRDWDDSITAPADEQRRQLCVRLDPPQAEGDAAVVSVSFEVETFIGDYYQRTGAPVAIAGTRGLGVAITAGERRIREIRASTLQPFVTLATRTSDTEGVLSVPAGHELPAVGATRAWRVGDPDDPTAETSYTVTVAAVDEEARTLTVSIATGTLPDAGTLGVMPGTHWGTWGDTYSRAEPPETHGRVYPREVTLDVSGWSLFAGAWTLVWNWRNASLPLRLLSGQRQERHYVHANQAGYDWPGWTAGDDCKLLGWRAGDCPTVYGTLTTRTSATAGVVTFPTAAHDLEVGDEVTLDWDGGGAVAFGPRTGMEVTGVAGADVTLSGGAGSDLPTEDWSVSALVTSATHCVLVAFDLENPDLLAMYGEHATGEGGSELRLSRRVSGVDYTVGPLREGGPLDAVSLSRDYIRSPRRLQFSWDPAADDPIAVTARTGPDVDGHWVVTLEYPARADGWTLPDVGETLTLNFEAADGAALLCPYSNPLGGFTGTVLTVDDTLNTLTWEVTNLDGVTCTYGRTGTLTTRTSDTEGVVTIDGDHYLAVGDTPVRLEWFGNARSGMTVDAVAGQLVTLSGGTGGTLPAAGTAVTVQVTYDREPPPVGAVVRDSVTWYAATRRHFDAAFSVQAELVDEG